MCMVREPSFVRGQCMNLIPVIELIDLTNVDDDVIEISDDEQMERGFIAYLDGRNLRTLDTVSTNTVDQDLAAATEIILPGVTTRVSNVLGTNGTPNVDTVSNNTVDQDLSAAAEIIFPSDTPRASNVLGTNGTPTVDVQPTAGSGDDLVILPEDQEEQEEPSTTIAVPP